MASKNTYVAKFNGQTYHGKAAKRAKRLDVEIAHHSRFNYYDSSRGHKPGSFKCK